MAAVGEDFFVLLYIATPESWAISLCMYEANLFGFIDVSSSLSLSIHSNDAMSPPRRDLRQGREP